MNSFQRQHDFLVAIDSDGCVFDTMELKHKECFIPAFIEHYHLQAVSKYARECWEFVNLYSKHRAMNRFPGLLESLKQIAERAEVAQRGVSVEFPQQLATWVAREKRLGNPALETAVRETGDDQLQQALAWSQDVNARIDSMVHGVPPFPRVREVLAQLAGKADVIVCSATPAAALQKEWQEHGIAEQVAVIFGQEAGTKRELLQLSQQYDAGKSLMIGDAPGDQAAAKANDCLFFPINPGAEEASWALLSDDGISRFFAGDFAGVFANALARQFDERLPATAAWHRAERRDA